MRAPPVTSYANIKVVGQGKRALGSFNEKDNRWLFVRPLGTRLDVPFLVQLARSVLFFCAPKDILDPLWTLCL